MKSLVISIAGQEVSRTPLRETPVSDKSTFSPSPVMEEVRKFWGRVYFRIARLNLSTFRREVIRGFCECSEEKYQELLSLKGKDIGLEFEAPTLFKGTKVWL